MVAVALTGAGNVTTGFANTGTSLVINKPANLANDDLLVACVWTRNATADYTTPPSGWTRVDPATTTNPVGVERLYYKVITNAVGEASTYTWAGGGSGRHAGVMFRVTGADNSDPFNVAGATVTGVTAFQLTLPTMTTDATNALYIGMACNNTTGGVITTATGSGVSVVSSASTSTGSGESTITVVQKALPSLGATGSQLLTFGTDPSGSVGHAVAINSTPVANTAPTCDAGADQTTTNGTPVVLSGTDSDSDGTVASRQWTALEYPRGASAPTISSATSATAGFTPTTPGAYVFQYQVTDNGAASTSDTTTVYVPANTVGVRKQVSATGFTNQGGASDSATALSDGVSTTYIESASTGSSSYRCILDPLVAPNATFGLDVTHLVSISETPTLYTIKLYQGATLRKTWTVTPLPTTSASTVTLTLTSGEIAAITNWNALELLVEWTV